ncbi:MAG: aldo/keto reductase [Gammaproteobacteria bacterium]|nr:aldo/keto reductase [Gammaproteobacteria bacterium]NNJ72508.1 L-glyceraldehyde 3-phosphate reductase [Enterobacterales bacterium]
MTTYTANNDRYDQMSYRRVGASGLKLPLISLGLWHHYGADNSHDNKVAMVCRAFDLGITHFDLANNYGPPPGSAESAFGKILAEQLVTYRDEIIVTSKAGYGMWPGPYGEWGSRKYLIASCDQSLKRTGLDYFDIFYSHRPDPDTPIEETMLALGQIIRSGKALYAGISNYNTAETVAALDICEQEGIPCIIHQPSYSMLNRWVENDGLLDLLQQKQKGAIVFSPLAQGLLTNKYLHGVPQDSRANTSEFFNKAMLNEQAIDALKTLAALADGRNQTLAQMALAWVLRHDSVSSALIGASSVKQIEDCAKAINNLEFNFDELMTIDKYANEQQFQRWADEGS